jgi:hypothetical protein
MIAVGTSGLAATTASAVAVFPAPGRAETMTLVFCFLKASTIATCSGDGTNGRLNDEKARSKMQVCSIWFLDFRLTIVYLKRMK